MTNEELLLLKEVIGSEKKYFFDGFYRVRENEQRQIEMAYLIPDGCGTTSVHPQITLEKNEDNQWVPIKLSDMGVTPNLFVSRDELTASEIDQNLKKLVDKMLFAIANNQHP